MSFQVQAAGPQASPDVAGVKASRTARAGEPATSQAPAAKVDSFDATPSRPPDDVLDQIAAAGQRYDELRAQKRELHFAADPTSNRVVVQVRDLDGNVLRTIPPSKALDIISGAPLGGG
ncbi:MAG: hypothetical protein QOJ07_1036 [Thermoleophilaceae bacterium]|jgi:flagellar protein FlaG|nr:hypothetical protein [Thermoleophilaceae bacterium]